jgi:hypothetical protein
MESLQPGIYAVYHKDVQETMLVEFDGAWWRYFGDENSDEGTYTDEEERPCIDILAGPWTEEQIIAHQARIAKLESALNQAVENIKQWHNMPYTPTNEPAWTIYYNQAPEMQLIRDALAPAAEQKEDEPNARME